MRENAKVGSLQLCIYLKVSAPVGLSLAPKSVLTTFLFSPWSSLWAALTSKFPQQACTKVMAFLSCPRTLATYITAATHITGRVTNCPSLPRAVHFQHCKSHVPGNLSVSGKQIQLSSSYRWREIRSCVQRFLWAQRTRKDLKEEVIFETSSENEWIKRARVRTGGVGHTLKTWEARRYKQMQRRVVLPV